jgi:hypothetical protein
MLYVAQLKSNRNKDKYIFICYFTSMKALRSYLSFPRGQRMGLVIFMSLLLILVAGLTMMHYNNAPEPVNNGFPAQVHNTTDSSGGEE